MSEVQIAAGRFKASCLKLMDQVAEGRRAIVVTKRGKPVVRVVPIDDKPRLRGALRGTVKIAGDIVGSTGERWDADR